jgi:tRNA(fMet)-specific endonuclease VapC
MKLLLDTNAYVALRRGQDAVTDEVGRADQILLSVIVAGELLYGFRNGSRFEQNARSLRAFLEDPSVALLAITMETADCFGRISAALRRRGTPIPTNDVWLAAQAIEAGATLISSDHHFSQVEGVVLLSFPAA